MIQVQSITTGINATYISLCQLTQGSSCFDAALKSPKEKNRFYNFFASSTSQNLHKTFKDNPAT